ncbi:MAG TPA: hypothetical protein VFF73_35855 [Planctomycetota bacterium]|nr:hypothetical protein [Planctomycetota bacterium]
MPMQEKKKDPFELRREVHDERHDVLRGEVLYHALLRAADRNAVLVVGEAAIETEHPNLANVVETTPFVLVEDLRETRTVAELVATDGAAHWQEAVELARHLARALAALHAAGLEHADLALSSVHVNVRWEPLLARALTPGDGTKNLRELGTILYALLVGGLPATEPLPPRHFEPEVPERLETLALDLLAGRIDTAARAALLLDAFRA